ncbi:MAG: hypothetical protein IPM26_01775 [Saprospiraceae bacterium]|nr:hypothetical protein [Saprospiraceae bacterium]
MNPIDKIFRERLRHHHMEVPDHLWEQIEAGLPVRSNKTGIVLAAMALFIVAVFVSLIGIEMLSYNTENLGKNTAFRSGIEDLTPGFAGQKPVSEAQLMAGAMVNKDIPTEAEEKRLAQTEVSGLKDSQNQKAEIQKDRTEITAQYINPGASAGIILSGQNNNQREGFNNAIEQNEDENPDIHTSVHHSYSGSDILLPSIGPLFPESQYSGLIKNGLLPGVKFNTIQQNCPSFNLFPGGLFAEVFYSSDIYQRHLEGDSRYQGYIAQRAQSEKSIYSYSAGLRVGYQFTNDFSARSGLEVKWINERFDYIDPESNQTRLVTIKDYVYQNGKIVDSIITQEVVIIPGAVKYSIHNTLRSIDIPLLLTFNVWKKGRFTGAITAGPVINVHTYQKGMLLSPLMDGNTITLSDNDTEGVRVFKSMTGLSMAGMISLQYKINSGLDLIVEPGFRAQLNSITMDNFPVQQRFTSMNLSTGVRYNF